MGTLLFFSFGAMMSMIEKEVVHKVVHDPEFLALIKKKNAISFSLMAIMLLVYFGFAALLALSPQTLAKPIGSATLGIALGIGVILVACVLTGIYVRWANTEYDSLIQKLNARLAEKQLTEKQAEETHHA
jgi:uncharacterized membrane protein (DUF485 family)